MKKFLISSVLSILMISMMGVSVFATSLFQSSGHTSNLPGSDNWNRGIVAPGNGYYMAYSYYYNSVNTHAAKAGLPNSTPTVTQNYAPGSTASANSKSMPSYNGAVIAAASYNGSWHYVKDDGSGDYVVSGW